MEDDLELVQILLQKNLLDQQQLVDCMRAQATQVESSKSLSEILLEKGLVSKEQLENARSELPKASSEDTRVLKCPACGSSYRVRVKEGMRYRCRKCKGVLAETKAPSRPATRTPTEVPSPAVSKPTGSDITAEISKALTEMESRMAGQAESMAPPATPPPRTTFEVNEATAPQTAKPSFPLSSDAPAEVREASKDPENEFGNYILVQLAGRGAMGQVWKAWDKSTDRFVAVKILQARGQEDLRRFRRESEIASNLDHPNIVKVYEIGTINERHFIAMEFVEGQTLRNRPGNLRQRLEAIAAVCDALEYAHRQGIVHRDIKPGNVMVAKDGAVKVTDFGLARPMSTTMRLKKGGEGVLGTPGYMSPEQARGKLDEVDARSDIFSLGATMYFLLTGAEPFPGGDSLVMIQKIIQEDPIPLRQVDDSIPDEVELITLKALQKQKLKRYASAAELAADIRKHLRGIPLELRKPPAPVVAMPKTGGRRWQLVTILLFLLLVSIAGGLLWLEQQGHVSLLRNRELDERLEALRTGTRELDRQAREQMKNFEATLFETPIPPAERHAALKPILDLIPKIEENGKEVNLAYRAEFARGWTHFAMEEFDAADKALARYQAGTRVPDPEAHSLRGRIALRAMQYARRRSEADVEWRKRAEVEFKQVLASNKPAPAEVALAQAALLFLANKFESCVQQSEKEAGAAHPISHRAALLGLRADALAALGKKQEAAEAYRACAEADRSDHTARFAESLLRHDVAEVLGPRDPASIGHLDEGIAAATAALALRRDEPLYLYQRGRLLGAKAIVQFERNVDAAEALEGSIRDLDAVCSSPTGGTVGADCHLLLSRVFQARAEWQRRSGQPSEPDLREAVRRIDAAITLRPGDPAPLAERAGIRRILGESRLQSDPSAGMVELEAALQDYNAAIQIRGQAAFFLARGQIYLLLSRHYLAANERARGIHELDQAILNLQTAAQGVVGEVLPWLELGDSQIDRARLSDNPKADLDAALNSFSQAIRIRADSARAYEGRGFAYYELATHLGASPSGRKPIPELQQAIKDWKEAISRDASLQGKLNSWIAKAEAQLNELEQ